MVTLERRSGCRSSPDHQRRRLLRALPPVALKRQDKTKGLDGSGGSVSLITVPFHSLRLLLKTLLIKPRERVAPHRTDGRPRALFAGGTSGCGVHGRCGGRAEG